MTKKILKVAAGIVLLCVVFWLGMTIHILATTTFPPMACAWPFRIWLAVWPVLRLMPDATQDAFVSWTLELCP